MTRAESPAERAFLQAELPAAGHPLARGRLHRDRLRDHRPRSELRRDHLLRHGDRLARADHAGGRPVRAGPAGRGCRTPTRSGSTACARPTWATRRRSRTCSIELLEALTGRALVAHVAAVERGFLGSRPRDPGLELRNPSSTPPRWTGSCAGSAGSRRPTPTDRPLRPGSLARPAGAPPASRRRRRPDDGPGVHRPGYPPGLVCAADARVAGAIFSASGAKVPLTRAVAPPFRLYTRRQAEPNRPTSSISGNSA